MKVLILLFVAIFLFTGCVSTVSDESDIQIDYAESFFSDFSIKGDDVYIYCTLKITNTSGENKKFRILATMTEDVESDLLTEEMIYCADISTGEDTFLLQAESAETFSVVIKGSNGGGTQKANRNLPPLKIELME